MLSSDAGKLARKASAPRADERRSPGLGFPIASMPLSADAVLIFILRSGVAGRLTTGRIERDGSAGLNVYSPDPQTINAYISGTNIRSWCVLGPQGKPLAGWCEILPEDRSRVSA